jgi:general secretion pathway protein D
MRHRWSSTFTGLGRRRTPFVPVREPLDPVGPEAAIQPGERLPVGKPDFALTHGSLMNRLAIPLKQWKDAFAISLAAALTIGTFCIAPHPAFAADSAKKLYAQGQAAEAREDFDAAYDAYRKAYAKSPTDLRMRASYYRLRSTTAQVHVTKGRRMLEHGDEQGALAQFLRASEIDPSNEAAIQEITKIRARQTNVPIRSETSLSEPAAAQIEDIAAPVILKPSSNEPLTLVMAEDTKVIYQAIGKAAGINVLFDPDYNGKRIQVNLNNVSLMDALRIVGTQSSTFWRPVTDNTVFVAQNSRAKRTEFDDQAVQTFYLSNAWQQNDLNDVQTALRNVLGGNVKVYGVPSQNAIVMRGTPDELILAQKVINDLDKARPEVVIDVAIMEVDKDKLRNIGVAWPGSISFALQPPQSATSTTTTTNPDGTTNTSSTALTLNNLANLNANNFAITVGSATVNLLMTDSDSKILQNPRIRATDSQKATMKIGSRIPIATGSYQTGAATAITSSLVNTQFQYIDVGVTIEITPTVHFDHDITLKLKIEDSSESGSVTISGVTEPILASKTSEQVIRLREGEATILAGILNKQDIASATGIPGLGELPLLRYIFGSKSHEVIDDEIVFVLVPHVVRGQDLSPLNLRRIDTGAGQSIELRHQSESDGKPAATPNPAAPSRPTPGYIAPLPPSGAQNRPSTVGPLTGQTAAGAMNSAMNQLRQGAQGDVPQIGSPATPAAPAAAPGAGPVSFAMTPEALSPSVGATFPLVVTLNGARDVSSVPLQIQYDASKLTLVNVDSGDLLGKDGQAVALVHRDDGPGMITIAASRPPGTAGVSGTGAVCVLSFQAKQAGESDVVITHPGALDSAQRPIAASARNAHIVVK